MARPKSTKQGKQTSANTLEPPRSSSPSPTTASPELLATMDTLKARITELENENAQRLSDVRELAALKDELATLKATATPNEPKRQEKRPPLHAGWF
jgi:hypothetical protein